MRGVTYYFEWTIQFEEAATRAIFLKKLFLKISQFSQENTCVTVFYSQP